MGNKYKVLTVEVNGTDLENQEELSLNAVNTEFDNTSNGFVANDVQGAVEELNNRVVTSASPGFSFGRSSNVNSGTWLQCEGVPSNKAGRWVYVNSAEVRRVFVSNELQTTFSIEVYYHDGNEINLTLLGTVNISNKYGDDFSVSWSVPTNKQLALKVSSGSARNIVAGLELKGTN